MKKSYILFASAALLFAGCANDEFTGDKGLSSDNAPIAFNMQTGAQTRATTESGSAAAGKLGNEFIVWGEKNEDNGKKATDGNLVFENYVVKYTSSTAAPTENTTLSNTKGWEYVGYTPYKDDYVSPSIGETTKQTIKYWDMKADSYTFTAVSAKSDDISGGTEGTPKVKIEKIEENETSGATAKGYTITVKDGASTGNIYVADRVVLDNDDKQSGTINRTEPNKYGGLVQFTFRNFETKIRFGIYETVPGYKVVITGIKYNGTAHPSESSPTDKTFGVDGNFIVAGSDEKTTTYTVTYEDATSTNPNKAVMTVGADPNKQTYMSTEGTNWLSTKWTSKEDHTCIGESATDATYDKSDDAGTDTKVYTAILPNKDNSTNLKLTVSYDLYSEDTGEKISVDYKTVEVPSQYCQWKNNYAYTYLFKITDSSAELYPITFDAVVETDENGKQETITTVTEPSITTFGVKDKKIITDKDEYPAGTDIYASVVVNGTVASDLSTNAALYTVTTDNETDFPITEASVANALSQTSVTGKVKATKVGDTATDKPSFVGKVPAEDGSERALSAMTWKGTLAEGATVTYYAVEYTKDGKKTYKIVKVVPATSTSTPTPMPGE